jgi:succinate dehydrogenase / fumarate reductase, cytochrome b subunit
MDGKIIMQPLRDAANGYLKYRGKEGQLYFLLHRITGIGLVLFLTFHILDTATVYFAPDLYPKAIALYRTTLFGIGEIGLIFCVFYHGVNGLKLAYFDLFAPKKWMADSEHRTARQVLILALILWIPSAVWMARNILINNFLSPGK